MSSTIMNVSHLSKNFGLSQIFSDISFSISKGETVGLSGSSGCGKSTLGRCLTRLEDPSSGEIFFCNKDIISLSQKELRKIRPDLQMIFQNPELSINPRMKLIESITEPLRLVKGLDYSSAVREVLPLMSIIGLRYDQVQRYPHQLSGGEIQRAIIVKVFSMNPSLIIADEATSMLDVSVQAQVIRIMQGFQKKSNAAFLVISHDITLLESICDKIFKMKDGKLINVSLNKILD